jgi:hypothetical protein
VLKAFRAWRYDVSRVPLGAVTGPDKGDPRHVRRLLDATPEDGDGIGDPPAPLLRARLRFAEWRRARILLRDDRPALTVVRRTVAGAAGEDAAALAIFGVLPFTALPLDDAAADADGTADPLADRLDALQVAVQPAVVRFPDAARRVRRALEGAIDREPDASCAHEGAELEVWIVDEDGGADRICALVSMEPLAAVAGLEHARAQRRWAARRAAADVRREGADDDTHGTALTFLHAASDPWDDAPLGLAFAPLTTSSSSQP